MLVYLRIFASFRVIRCFHGDMKFKFERGLLICDAISDVSLRSIVS
jgi:hypothetical protein